MKTTFDQLTILYQRLVGSPLDAALTGGIYLQQRPNGSDVEDVVINSLPVSGSQIQLGTANVNLYVPNLTVKVQGKPQSVPNTDRLKHLTDLATVLLEAYTHADYSFWLVNQGLIAEPETAQHYVNMRIAFRFLPPL